MQSQSSPTHVDIHDLFLLYNVQYFDGVLEGVEVKWSSRMTLCAGVCVYEGVGRGGGGFCSIRLSEPLLKFRPNSDIIDTLLHEMIHAYLCVTQNHRDHDAHGPLFLHQLHRINELENAHITVFHHFHEEVAHYRQHHWRCSGPCRNRPPFYGYVKRAMNRKPQPSDRWWSQHQSQCSGVFEKIHSPAPTTARPPAPRSKIKHQAKKASSSAQQPTLPHLFSNSSLQTLVDGANSSFLMGQANPLLPTPSHLQAMRDHDSSTLLDSVNPQLDSGAHAILLHDSSVDASISFGYESDAIEELFACPVCMDLVGRIKINSHLDTCLNNQST